MIHWSEILSKWLEQLLERERILKNFASIRVPFLKIWSKIFYILSADFREQRNNENFPQVNINIIWNGQLQSDFQTLNIISTNI